MPWAVPGEHTASNEGMPKIVYARTHASWNRFELRQPQNTGQQLSGPVARVSAACMLMPEQRGVRSNGCPGFLASTEIRLKCCDYTVRERQAPRFEELGAPDLDGAIVDLKIADVQTHDFTDTETDTVGQHEHHVQCLRPQR